MTVTARRAVSFGVKMDEQAREFKGIWFPREVWLDTRLTAVEKMILLEIDSLDNESGCYASNEYLAQFCQCSETKVSGAISKLKKLGYIEVISFDGRKRTLHSCLTIEVRQGHKNCEAESQKVGERILVESSTQDSKKERKQQKPTNYDSIIAEYTQDQELSEAIIEFVKMRKLNKSIMTDRALKQLLKRLDSLASDTQGKIDLLNQSILNGWKSVYPIKDTGKGSRHDSQARGTGRNDDLESLGYLRFRTDIDL